MIHILAISGSLSRFSKNTILLHAASKLAPEGIYIDVFGGLGELPPFNPDVESSPPQVIIDWRELLKKSDGLMIACPEYAHGVPGVLKNAFDWVVGSGEIMHKPIALINTTPSSKFAVPSLKETLTVMMGVVVPEASLVIPVAGNKFDEAGMMANQEISGMIMRSVEALAESIRKT
ncbi:NAD(P)H-dependent oxidoreductase [bacterium]|nr:NAD(P)H-dependent oxidoreductase [bacterium]